MLVVCSSTLRIRLGVATSVIKVPHRSHFDAQAVRRQQGITVSAWDDFVAPMNALVERPMDTGSVEGLLRRVLTYPVTDGRAAMVNERELANARAFTRVVGGECRLLPA